MSSQCPSEHDWFTATLTFGLCVGLIISYMPQHFRIYNKSSSEGLSPWFLLLGSTSAASGMLNMFMMQWRLVKCCSSYSFGTCIEKTAGIFQVSLQWILFTMIFVLFIIYYPQELRYQTSSVAACEFHPSVALSRSKGWQLSLILSWLTFIHFICIIFITFFLLSTEVPAPDGSLSAPSLSWATFLGVSSAIIAAIQYMPQLWHTYHVKLVGALSIPMMLIQTPGAILMVLSIALRPGTNWTSWITFAVAGVMQGSLLTMCLVWKVRQRRLEIDDFGHPLSPPITVAVDTSSETEFDEDDVPGLITSEGEDPRAVKGALVAAIESAVETDVRSGFVPESESGEIEPHEQTPLLSRSPPRENWRRWLAL